MSTVGYILMRKPPKVLQRGFIQNHYVKPTVSPRGTIEHICKVTESEKLCRLNIQSKSSYTVQTLSEHITK